MCIGARKIGIVQWCARLLLIEAGELTGEVHAGWQQLSMVLPCDWSMRRRLQHSWKEATGRQGVADVCGMSVVVKDKQMVREKDDVEERRGSG